MSRYIDADRLMKDIDSAESIGFGIIETKLVRDLVNDTPTADVVERKDAVLDKANVYCRFEDIDGNKNIVFKLPYALTDITDIRIRLDKYRLRENVNGEWKRTPTGQPYCSVCGDFPWEHNSSTRDFCSECGADMRGEV